MWLMWLLAGLTVGVLGGWVARVKVECAQWNAERNERLARR